MSFLSNSPRGKSGLLPLSPSPGLFQRAETTLLNKLAFLSTTTGRFCSRCHLVCFLHCFVVPIYYHGREKQSRKKSCERRYPFSHGNTAPAFLAVPYKNSCRNFFRQLLVSGWGNQASFALAAAIIWTHSWAIALSPSVRFSRGARTPPMSGPPDSRRISLIMAYILHLPEHIL